MIWSRFDGRRYAHFETISALPGFCHAFSTRPQDVSARHDSRAPERAARRAEMAGDLGLDPAAIHHCEQVHRLEIAVVRERGAAAALPDCDGAVTAAVGVPLMCFSADCPLILACDPVTRSLGVAHASWRCTVGWMARRLVERLASEFGSRPGDLLVGVGPSAGPTQYEVKDDVIEAASAAGIPGGEKLFLENDGRRFFDLWDANRRQLIEAGVARERIEIAGICTMSRTDLFYSYRREGAGCGHFGLMAALV